MEFKVVQRTGTAIRGWIPTFHDITKRFLKLLRSGVKTVPAIVSHHTTCSIMIQECSHDLDTFDLEYLQHDLLDGVQTGA